MTIPKLSTTASCVLGVLLLMGPPTTARAQPSQGLPLDLTEQTAPKAKEMKIDEGTKQALWVAGLVTFGVGYAALVIVASAFDLPTKADGRCSRWPGRSSPWRRGSPASLGALSCRSGDRLVPIGLVTASLAQIGGIALSVAA
ncbi:MAG: hypothetical protein R3B72_50425 [Polyangiaceae bacterium]